MSDRIITCPHCGVAEGLQGDITGRSEPKDIGGEAWIVFTYHCPTCAGTWDIQCKVTPYVKTWDRIADGKAKSEWLDHD